MRLCIAMISCWSEFFVGTSFGVPKEGFPYPFLKKGIAFMKAKAGIGVGRLATPDCLNANFKHATTAY
jgi:hypothetical protein